MGLCTMLHVGCYLEIFLGLCTTLHVGRYLKNGPVYNATCRLLFRDVYGAVYNVPNVLLNVHRNHKAY